IDVINEILEEDFDALIDEGSKILHSIEGTILEENLFAEFDEFMAMTVDETQNLNPTSKNRHSKKSPLTPASVFLISKTTMKDIEKVLKGFLWSQEDLKKGVAKVCAPKSEGGLGLKRLGPSNEDLLCKHLFFWQTEPKQILPWMHTRASNYELVEPLPEPERTLNRRLRRRNRRVPFEQRNEPRAQPKVVYASILDISYFCHFLDIFENYNSMDDELMWATNHVVALTPGFAIIIPETANEFAIKGNHLTLIKENQFDGRIKTDLYKHIHEFF
nr:RNA-directed DNA polymerase, eukaryota, reverse transcriptase zinc-binding domain protein [Tanacetum cinerariifolium]